MANDAPQGPPGGQASRLQQAIALLASDPAAAEASARELLAAAPGDADAQAVLASAMRMQGRPNEALALLAPLAEARPGSWVAQYELGQALFALGQSRAAAEPLARALGINAALAPGWRLLGDIRLASGDVQGAQDAYDRLLCAVLPDRRLIAAVDAMAGRRFEAAEASVRAVLAASPGAVPALHVLGEVLRRIGRLAEAEQALAEGVARSPNLQLVRQSYALVLLASGRQAAALVELDKLLDADPACHRCRMMKAAALTEIGDFEGAAKATSSVLQAFPDQPQAWLLHGNGLRTLGRIDQAIAAYERCIELDPDRSEAYWSLSNLKTYRFTGEACDGVRTRLARPGLALADRSYLHFTLGKAHEDAGRFAEAFQDYLQGNALQRELRGYDPDRMSAFVRAAKALHTPAFFAERAGWGEAAADPIFIVGLPRSGSTLVDQILASHPAVEGTRELQDVQVIADWIALQSGPGEAPIYLEPLCGMPRATSAKLGGDYLGWTRAQRRQKRPRFTDKAPWNFLHVGLIQLILPNAKIIDVRRHPLGCGLSAFRQHFGGGFDFTYDLQDIGRYYADYVELMAHYEAVLPGRVHRVIYERLVEDTEAEVRSLLAHLGLPFDPACLRFFENPRAVATPSSEQVRRPIFADGVGQWRNFEPWLDPLKAALGPVLAAYPDPPARFQSFE